MNSLNKAPVIIRANMRKPLAGWLFPLIATALPILALAPFFYKTTLVVGPAALFSSTLYTTTLVIVTVSLCAARYNNSHYGYDIVAISAFLSSLPFMFFSVGIEDSILKSVTGPVSLLAVNTLMQTAVMVTATILLVGLPLCLFARNMRRSRILLWLIPSLVVSGVLAYVLAGDVGSAFGSASSQTYSMFMLVSGIATSVAAAYILSGVKKPVFARSYQGLIIFLSLQAAAMMTGNQAEYSFIWYMRITLTAQSYLFPLWGMLADFRDYQARDRQLSTTLEETGNWLLGTMMASQEHYSILSTISRSFSNSESFSYLSKGGSVWELEDSNQFMGTGLPELPPKMNIDLRDIETIGHISTISDAESSDAASQLRKLIGSSFIVTISGRRGETYRLTGVREADRIIWTDSEKRFIWFLSRLYATSLLQRNIIERRAETVSQLLAMVQTTRILTRLDDDAIKTYDEAVGAMVEMLGYENTSLWLVRHDGSMKPAAWRWPGSPEAGSAGNLVIKKGNGIVGRSALEMRPIVVPDTSKESGYINLFGEKTRSEFAFPIVVEDKCFAVLDVQSTKQEAFEPLDQEVISTVGRMLSFAVVLRRLYAEAHDRTKIAEARSGLIAHDLRNILQALSTHVELLSMKSAEYPKFARDALANIDALRSGIENAHRFLEEVLTIAKLEAGKIGTIGDYNAVDMINSSLSLIKESFPQKQFEMSLVESGRDHVPMIRGTEFVKDVFMNLFSNSAKYTDGQMVKIDVRLAEEKANGRRIICVEVSDRGRGIEPKRAKEIFNRFNKGASGTGLGLPLVKLIMESVGGNIEIRERVEGDYGQGTRFALTFQAADGSADAARAYDFAKT